MALATTDDYKLLVNQLLYYIEAAYGGINWYGMPSFTQMLPEDAAAIRTAYAAYKQTRDARPTSTEVSPGDHGVNQSTFLNG